MRRFRVWGLGFRVGGLGFGVQGFRSLGLSCMKWLNVSPEEVGYPTQKQKEDLQNSWAADVA